MTPQLTHPSGVTLLRELGSFFRSPGIFTSRDRRLVFLCGGPVVSGKNSFRKKFLSYARKSLPDFRFFLAEDATRDLFKESEAAFVNIAEFESLISNLADCILLIPESDGSIAELGYFTAQQATREKLFVVNEMDFQEDESFIKLGPIDIVNRYSRFRPALHLNLRAKSPNFRPIVKQLRRFELEIRGHFEFKQYDQLPVRHRLFLLFELIYLFGRISYDAIEYTIGTVFMKDAGLTVEIQQELRQLLSVLCAGQYVQRLSNGDTVLSPISKARPFLEVPRSKIDSMRLKINDFARRVRP